MTIPRRHVLQLVAAATLLTSPRMARADDYPSRPITVIVPFSAGGPLDITGRMIAAKMQQTLGQPIVIENVGGAGGSIGVGRGARAVPDGYTLTMGIWSTHVVNPVLYDLSYDVEKDFEPIAPITDGPLVICARKDFPANDLKELIAWLKANPDKATSSDAGVGSPQHVFGVLFQQVTGTRFQFVHYRGGGQAMQDLVTGHVDLSFSDAISALTQVQGGTIKTYAVMSKKPAARRTANSERRRSGVARLLRLGVERHLGAERHAEGHHRQAQCRGRRCRGRPDHPRAAHRARTRAVSARANDAASARHAAADRNREMVAHHQGRGHPRRIGQPAVWPAGSMWTGAHPDSRRHLTCHRA